MNFVATPQITVVTLPSWRRQLLLLLILLGYVVLLGRSLYLQGAHREFLQQKGEARYTRSLTLPAQRGNILDRNGDLLAISSPVESIWASPADMEISRDDVKSLAKLLEVKPEVLNKKFADNKKEFVYLKRRLSPEAAAKVMQLRIPGIFTQREYKRYYPAGEVTAHIVGFAGLDEIGQEGFEFSADAQLSGKPGKRHVIKDRQGRIIEDLDAVEVPRDGQDVTLSIDKNIQYLAYRELARAVEMHKAKAAAIVVLDAKTGEVLGMANVPSYNPNNRVNISGKSRNRAMIDIFEPGSTLKPFTVATALELGIIKPETQFETAPGFLTIGPAVIRDAHPHGLLSVTEIVQKSSNVGTSKIALAMKPQQMWSVFNQVGFGRVPHSGFPGESSGKLRNYKTWRPIEQATMSYGHGISMSLAQLARAYTVFANDGELRPISMLKLKEQPIGTQVFSAETARNVRAMLELVVLPGGTALKAQVAGYRVAGKTGTAHKPGVGGYQEDKYVASFVGFAPASNPRLIVAVMVDEPSNGQYYGGAVAAPVFSRVMSDALRMLSVPQDAPNDNVVIPLEGDEVKEST